MNMDENDTKAKRNRRKTLEHWKKLAPRTRGTGERLLNMDENDAKDKKRKKNS